MSQLQAWVWALLIVIFVVGLGTVQALYGAKIGTDHAVHVFLVRALRRNRHRLFVKIPGILNCAVVAALPIYLHQILSYLGSRSLILSERLLNPIMNGVLVLMFAAVLARWGSGGFEPTAVGWLSAVACFAFTPQFYHALSARNFGLSSRSVGIVALTITLYGAWRIGEGDPLGWVIGVSGAFAIWAFSTFAAQALVMIAVLFALLFQRFAPLGAAAGGIILFVAIHPRYSLGYLRHTIEFLAEYRRALAPIYILARRHSVWRDLVWDIPRALIRNFPMGMRYAYENPVLVVALLNSLTLAAAWSWLTERPPGITGFAAQAAICGLVAMLLTSLRATRFLGEPERYVEAVTPWATLAGAAWVVDRFGQTALWGTAAAFFALALIQLAAFGVLFRVLSARPFDLDEAKAAIMQFAGSEVRLAGNNEHFTKLFMVNDWQFAYCIAVGRGYAGMPIHEAFERFPVLRQEAFERIVARYRINVCVLDRTVGERPFEKPPADLIGSRLLHQSPTLNVYGLTWRDRA